MKKHNLSNTIIILILILFICNKSGISQNNNPANKNTHITINEILDDSIYTAILKNSKSEYINPIYELNSEFLELSFDDLQIESRDFIYEVVQCNADWSETNKSPFDYLEGFEENPIQDFENSFNTLIPYRHYSITIPNDDIKITKSGNYLLKVYEDTKPKKLVFTKRILIFENLITIDANIKRANNLDLRSTHQEIDFTIIADNYDVMNAYDDLKVLILQNNRYDNIVDNLIPKYIKNNEFIYDYDLENTISGGNEFRSFNIKNTRFISENISNIEYIAPFFHIKLTTDQSRVFKQYYSNADLNGSFKIDLENSNYPNLEADYVYVYFNLPVEVPYITGDVYVNGAFNSWIMNKRNKMIYNFDKQEYQLKMLMKQGYYNYMYFFTDNYTKSIDSELFEGSHYQTENDYFILVYCYDYSEGYDKLIGFKKLNSKELF